MMKRLLVALIAVLSIFSVAVSADTNSNYEIGSVTVDGMDISTHLVNVERGESQELGIYLTGTGVTTDVNIRAWIGGYEYDNVLATSAMFDIEDCVSYQKKLTLEFPTDLEADQEYTLYVEVYDDVDSVTYSGTIMVSKVRHSLEIQDVLVDSNVDAGDYTTATVRVENLGDKKEEDIKVTVSAPELGISQSTYIDELTAHEDSDNDDEDDNEEEDSESSEALYLDLSGKEAGTYKLYVNVEYNNGNDEIENEYTLILGGGAGEQPSVEEESIIEATVSSKS